MRAARLKTRQWTNLTVAVAVAWWLAVGPHPCAEGQAPPQIKGQVKAPLPEVAEARKTEQALSINEIKALQQVIYHERRSLILLDRARQFLKEDELSQAFDALQSLLGDPQELLSPPHDWTRAPSDSFYLADRRLRSVRHEAQQIFESLTDDQLSFYEQKYSDVANSALQVARESGRSAAYLEIARRCFPTLAGAQATDEAATRLLDRGHAAIAAKLWLRIVRSKVHRQRLHPRLFEKAAIALFLSGDQQQARQVIADAERIFGTVQFTAASIELVAQHHPQFTGPSKIAATHDPFGGPTNNGSSRGSVPYLAPVWTQPLYGKRPFESLAAWERSHAETELQETGVAVFPIVSQNQVITRDLQGIRSCDPRTGRLLWRYNSTLSVPDFVRELRDADIGRSATLIESAWTENSAQGIITSDGRRVFAINWLRFETLETPGRRLAAPGRRLAAPLKQPSNQIVCLEIPTDSRARRSSDRIAIVTPVWSAGGTGARGILADHFFLGAPRPIDDALFVISESRRDRELNLVKLDAASGRVIWIQKLGLVARSSFNSYDRSRDLPMALPAVADGIVICQPDSEIIVAVDADQGELKWIHAYGYDGTSSRLSRGRFKASRSGFRGFPSTPLIHRQAVYCLPQHSEDLFCLDLNTGQRMWKVQRAEDYHLAAATDEIVASVGKHGMRGLSPSDGSVVWSARIGLPSGRGVRLEDRYIVPLKSGEIASVDLNSGDWTRSSVVPALVEQRYDRSTEDGTRMLHSPIEHDLAKFGLNDERVPDEVRPGNLLFHDGLVLSVGPQHLTAFREALTMLQEQRQKAAQDEPIDQVLTAQLELSAGQEDAAAARLAELIATFDQADELTESESSTANRARWLLRDLIVRRLNQAGTSLSADQKRTMIVELGRLSEGQHEVGYALLEHSRWEAENVSPASAVSFARQAIETGAVSFIPMKGSPGCIVAASAYARDLVRQSLQSSSLRDRARLQDVIERDLQVALSLDTVDSLDRFLKLYSAVHEAGRVRNRLADRLVQKGRVQEAELLILQNRSHPDTEVRAVAEALLISLWSQLKLSFEAATALYRFSQDFGDASLGAVLEDRLETVLSQLALPDSAAETATTTSGRNSIIGADFVSLFSGDAAARRIFTDLHPVDLQVRRVSITQRSLGSSNPLVTSLWKTSQGSPRRVIYGQKSEFDIVRPPNGLQSEWRILDRLAGTERGRIEMPARITIPGSQGYRSVGHLMPVGTPAGMLSVSLLEHFDERPFWKLRFPPLDAEQRLIEPGPATPSVSIFQSRRHLFGIESANGRVLWRRSDLDLASGVFVDREAGLFGDEHVLVMFHADQKSYTLFSSQTGEIIRKGKLNVDFRYPHRVIGRKLFHVTLGTDNTGKRIRIWDPLTGNMDLDEEIVDTYYSAWSAEGELALMTTDTRLRVLSADNWKPIADIQLTPAETKYRSSLRLFSDDRNVYVNLQRSDASGSTDKIYSLASDSVVPVDHVHRGLLIALSRDTGKVLWKKPVQQRSFVRIDRCSVPFLVGLSRVSPKRGSNIRALEVRVIDRMTGEDLVEPTSMIQDRIVHYQVDRDAGELQLHGIVSRIDLQFRRLRKQIPLQEQPL
jgi:outer membrane protein assembly factor BamB